MQFCKKCGTLLAPEKQKGKTVLVCRRCGKTVTKSSIKGKLKLVGSSVKGVVKKVLVVDKKSKFDALPKTHAQCPKCENTEALWWMEQTRSSDEAPTRFYKCTKCHHTWREYE